MTDQPTKRPRWTEQEDATLRRMAALGADPIAIMLNRSVHQVRGRAVRLGISLRTSGQTRGRKGRHTAQAAD